MQVSYATLARSMHAIDSMPVVNFYQIQEVTKRIYIALIVFKYDIYLTKRISRYCNYDFTFLFYANEKYLKMTINSFQ